MDWIMAPVSGFQTLNVLAADKCSGGGTSLLSCTCQGGLVVCQCSGGLEAPKQQVESG